MSEQQVTSFVLRFSKPSRPRENESDDWRIRITHVQEQKEFSVKNLEEAVSYMQTVLGKRETE